MIRRPSNKKKEHPKLSRTTLTTIRNLARKGTDADLEEFMYEVASYYIANMQGAEWVDPKDYLKVTGKTWEFVCPECGARCELDLKGEVDG